MLVLALDAMDSSGEQHLEISHHIYKRRLDMEGNPLEEPKRENITVKVKSESTKVLLFLFCISYSNKIIFRRIIQKLNVEAVMEQQIDVVTHVKKLKKLIGRKSGHLIMCKK